MDLSPASDRHEHHPLISNRFERSVLDSEATLVLGLRARGATIADIAERIGVSESTTARRIYAGMSALGISTQAELIVFLEPTTQPSSLPSVAALTPAEREVTELVVQGRSNTEIGELRRTSKRTVANQLQSIYEKLGVGSRRELVARLLVRSEYL